MRAYTLLWSIVLYCKVTNKCFFNYLFDALQGLHNADPDCFSYITRSLNIDNYSPIVDISLHIGVAPEVFLKQVWSRVIGSSVKDIFSHFISITRRKMYTESTL